nr:hypothetical protein [Tanacetum cinerariifolium]
GEGSRTPTKPHNTPSPEAQQSPHTAPTSASLPPATTETIPTLTPTVIPTLRDVSQGEAFPTISGLEAGQDRENIIKTSALPHDSTPRVTSLAADEGSMKQQLNELTDLYTRLQRQQSEMATKFAAQELEIASLKARLKLLEDKDGGGTEPSGEDATIKGRSLETGEEAGVEKSTDRGSNDTEELLNIVKDAEIARIHAEEELQMLIDGLDKNNEIVAKYLQEYEQFAADLSIEEKIDMINELVKYQDHYAKVLKYRSQQSKPLSKKQQREFYMSVLKSHSRWKTKHFMAMTLEEIREKFIPVWKQIEDFVPMASKE